MSMLPSYVTQNPLAEMTVDQLRAEFGRAMSPVYRGAYSPVQLRQELNRRQAGSTPARVIAPPPPPDLYGNPEDYVAPGGLYSVPATLPPMNPPPVISPPRPTNPSLGVEEYPQGVPLPSALTAPVMPSPAVVPPTSPPVPGAPTAPRAARRAAAPTPASTPPATRPEDVDAAMSAGDPTATMRGPPPGLSASDQNKWLAVMSAGLGMMGQEGGTALGNIGKGGLIGVKNYQDWEKDRRTEEQRTRSLDITEKYREDQARTNQQNADTRLRQMENALQIAQMRALNAGTAAERATASAEVARIRAETDRLRYESQDRAREAARDPVRGLVQNWNTNYNRALQQYLSEKNEVTGRARHTPEEAAALASRAAGPQVIVPPNPMREAWRAVQQGYMSGAIPLDKYNERAEAFRRQFNIDPRLHLE